MCRWRRAVGLAAERGFGGTTKTVRFGHGASCFTSDLSFPVRFGHCRLPTLSYPVFSCPLRTLSASDTFLSYLFLEKRHSKARLQIKLKQSVPFLSPVFPLAFLIRAGRTLLPNRPAPVRFGHGASRFVSDLSSSDFSDFFGIFSVTF